MIPLKRFHRMSDSGLSANCVVPPFPCPSNIAEGKAHYSNRDFVRFLRHARGSLAEIETQVLIAQQRKYLNSETVMKLTQKIDELGRILSGLINSLQTEPLGT